MSNSRQPYPFAFSEADPCREYVTPAIQAAGLSDCPFQNAVQCSFIDGRIVPTGRTAKQPKGAHKGQKIMRVAACPRRTHLPQRVSLEQNSVAVASRTIV